MEAIKKDLNKAQQEAVLNYSGPALVIAGAGSGKTRVLTYRIAYLLHKGFAPQKIIALTFTNKAANEMKGRIAQLVSPNLAKRLWMGTFHSIFARILRNEAGILGFPNNYTIYDTIDSKSLVKTIIRELNLDDRIYKPSEVFGRISSAKNNLITPDVYTNSQEIQAKDQFSRRPQLGEIYRRYVVRCKQYGAMDFDDLLLNTNLLFRDHPDILEKYRNAFDFILVDEYQDTNYSQYLIVKKLAELHKNICVVGDDAQSIYSFRGARIENILNFKNDYPDYRLFKLEQNYRSTRNIVGAANSVISKNREQISKSVFSKNETGEKILVVKAQDDREEGFMVAKYIADLRFRDQLEYRNFAVLYRTNAQSRIFEESMRRMNIPYKVYGSLSFYQRKEIKDLLAYFRLTVNPRDDESLRRIINYPLRGIGKTTVDRITVLADKLNVTMWDVLLHLEQINPGFNAGTVRKLMDFTSMLLNFQSKLMHMEAFDLAYEITRDSGILDELRSDGTPENISRYENVEELLNGIKDFTDNYEGEGEMTLSEYLQNVTLMTDADNESEDDINKVSIMTVHSAKGLEFRNVIIAGMEEELFPSNMNIDNPKDLEEERRLFYVALTRAEKSALITYAASRYRWGLQTSCSPSRFINEIDPGYLILPPDFYPVQDKWRDRDTDIDAFTSLRKRVQPAVSVTKPVQDGKRPVNMASSDPGFRQSSLEEIREGMKVEHPRFGIGIVEKLEGSLPNTKATVGFPAGRKQLLLKFAKLRVVR
ncbi:MAG: UvrD-helicase domain-containing protein [Bacteroidales bacterium]|nr:UvrD-helicase domain-containing protein [Bacteroidales bacterium]MBN2698125.1 UvrD-helicase domain-containing protein [Bacteroidales bacterium]